MVDIARKINLLWVLAWSTGMLVRKRSFGDISKKKYFFCNKGNFVFYFIKI